MAALRRALGYYGVIIAYVVAIWVFGIFIASAVFLVFFLRVLGKTSWRVPVIGVIVVLGGMLILENLVTVLWPSYLLEDVIGGFMPG